MRRQRDRSYLEAALRQTLARRPVPTSLGERVLAEIRAEPHRGSARSDHARFHPWFTMRMTWAFATCTAMAVVVLLLVALPIRQDRGAEEAAAMEAAEIELAEVLQLAGHKWNTAREAALSPIQENDND